MKNITKIDVGQPGAKRRSAARPGMGRQNRLDGYTRATAN
jgi:hypothetical protein